MEEIAMIGARRMLSFCFRAIIFCNVVYIVYYLFSGRKTVINENYSRYTDERYLVNTPGCIIENIEVYSPEIKKLLYKVDPISCTDKPHLAYTTEVGGKTLLSLNTTAFSAYSYLTIECCYKKVERNPTGPKPDDNLIFSECIPFTETVEINVEVIKVKCSTAFLTVYENVYAIFKPPREVPNKNYPNVLLIGIDGVSASNFIRTMPKTHDLLKASGWVNLKGYNKVEDNTFPNVIAVIAGAKFSYHEGYFSDKCNPYDSNKLESCNFLWKTFKKANYTTALGEDTPKIGTFNSNKAGFVAAPTDYYFRPYFIVADQLPAKYLCLKSYCTGPEKTGNRMLNLITGFLSAIDNRTPGFGLFWMNTFSHEDVNCPSSMDDEFVIFFKKLVRKGYMENSIIIFFSDHGFRFGKIRLTPTGWVEERLPFIYIWIPEKFRKSHAEEYKNLVKNTEKLTSNYDLYMTLQHVLALSSANFHEQPADGCSGCRSLFRSIPSERTCSEAGIPEHYCTCSKYETIDKNTPNSRKLAEFFLEQLNSKIRSYGHAAEGCASFSLEGIAHVKRLVVRPGLEENYLIRVVTNPEANFEATVKVTYDVKETMLLKEINRLDRYAPTSYCANGDVRMYCYCKSVLKKITNIFCNNKYCFI
ncbi:unnamed protein product [Phyllotreta striolata]|uniref:Uncharacterized protein n=1 Tax=Phyllotreta striolata TaxID=444603 RepID=A0A9P0DWM6_PHYSR|nr:unnamed protein product [Phyllotreta striolata]